MSAVNDSHALVIIAVVAAVTALLRFLPFAVFSGQRKPPEVILHLGRVLPCATMGMLVVYCLREVDLTRMAGWLPEAIASAAVVLLHLWKRSTILSILGGTVLYMVLVQLVFA